MEPPWGCRLKEMTPGSYFCLPLSHSVTLDKISAPASVSPSNIYSAVSIRFGAISEFIESKMGGFQTPRGAHSLVTGLPGPAGGQGLCSGSWVSLHSWAPNAGRFWSCRESLAQAGDGQRAGGQCLGCWCTGSSTLVPG